MQEDRQTGERRTEDVSPFTTIGTVENTTAGSQNSYSDTGAGMQGPSLTGECLYDSLPPR